MDINSLIDSLLLVGGIGSFNYFIISRTTDISITNKDENILTILLTYLDFNIYKFTDNILNCILNGKFKVVSLMVSIFIALLVTLIFPKIFCLMLKFINLVRKKNNLPNIVESSVWDKVFNDYSECFIFDFNANLISKGFLKNQNGEAESKSLILYEYTEEDILFNVYSEHDLRELLKVNNIESFVYIDFENRIKIICF